MKFVLENLKEIFWALYGTKATIKNCVFEPYSGNDPKFDLTSRINTNSHISNKKFQNDR